MRTSATAVQPEYVTLPIERIRESTTNPRMPSYSTDRADMRRQTLVRSGMRDSWIRVTRFRVAAGFRLSVTWCASDHPLQAIRRMTDEAPAALSPEFALYSDEGRPSNHRHRRCLLSRSLPVRVGECDA